jgi:hypothetical protein|tara:strand:+ start:96 stop:269 length:174 start_codon:yes stop_codon:yes gene_type:complete
MKLKRLSYKDKLWYAKEEVKDLERLLIEAQERLNREYLNIGGRTWFQWTLYMIGLGV